MEFEQLVSEQNVQEKADIILAFQHFQVKYLCVTAVVARNEDVAVGLNIHQARESCTGHRDTLNMRAYFVTMLAFKLLG